MIETKIDNEDMIKLLNTYKQENDDLKRQIEEKIALAKQKFDEAYNLLEKEDYEGAIKLLSEVIKLDPDDFMAYYNRGDAYKELGEYELAISDYNKAIELYPNAATAYNNRGLAYEALGDMINAQADFARADELGYNG